MKRLAAACFAVAAVLILADAASADSIGTAAGPGADRVWRFEVLLDDKPIGRHEFRLRRDGEVEQVDIEARFEVNLLFITAYEYDHSNTERWVDGCLSSIRSRTDDNGELFSVQGSDLGGRFELQRNAEPQVLEKPCLRTFAYWDRSALDSNALLNSQTGLLEPVKIEYLGPDTVEVGGRPVPSDRYALSTEDGDIQLWYASDTGHWLALQAPARGDRVLRYRPLAVPGIEPASGEPRLAME